MGAGGSKTEEGMDSSVLEELPESLRDQITKHFKQQKDEFQELSDKYEKLKFSSNKNYFELEKQLIETQGDLNLQTDLATQLKEQVVDLERKYNSSTQELRDLQEKELDYGKQRDALLRSKHSLELEKQDLSEMVDTKNKEIDRLQEEWKEISQRANTANKARFEAIAEKDEAESEFAKIQHQLARMQQEKDMLTQQVSWLETTLKEKSDDLLNGRKDQASRALELQSELDQKEAELVHAQEQLAQAQSTLEQSRESNEKYINKLEELGATTIYRNEQFKAELHTLEKLIALYKQSSEEAEERCKEFQKGAEELQSLLTAALKAKEEIESRRIQDSVRFATTLDAKVKAIEKLETELKNANDLLRASRKRGAAALLDESIEELSPSAAAASKLLKSGMTLTQIYSEYVTASEKLMVEEQENQRLSQCLETIMAEVSEKAPILKQQREDYERALQAVDLLTAQLDTAVTEAERRQIHSDETNRHCAEVTRENERLKRQCVDLGCQVRMLLKELEQARGTIVTDASDVTMQENESSAQNVITEKLVTFRSIEELQEQNQKLLGVVRELSEQQERDEQGSVDARTQQLTKQLESAMQEMNDMRASRERQVQLMEAIVRQRDMYKALLAQPSHQEEQEVLGTTIETLGSTSETPQRQQMSTPASKSTPRGTTPSATTPRASSRSPGVERSVYEEAKAALKELQQDFNKYRQEKGENEKMLNEEIDRLRSTNSELRINAAKVSTQLTYSEERYKTVHSNIGQYKLEISALSDKNTKYTASIVKHEQTIAMLREELMANQEKLTRAEVTCDHLRQQCETLRAMEARVSQEKESVMREQRSQQLLMTSLQAIQNNLERSEFETRTLLNNRIEQLEKENVLVKRKLDQAQDHQRTHIQTLEKQLVEARDLLGSEDMDHRKTTSELHKCREQLRNTESQLRQVESQLAAARAREEELQGPQPVISTQAAVSQEQLRTLKTQLSMAKANAANLEGQLKKSQGHVEQYKAIADTMEKNLAETTRASKQMQEKLELEVAESREKLLEMETELEELQEKSQNLMNENTRLATEIKKSSSGLRQQIETLQTELKEAVQRREAAILNEQRAISDRDEQVKRANEAQDKYQRELMLHASDVTSLTQVKDELEGFAAKLRTAEEETKRTTEQLKLEQAAWEEQKKLLEEERGRLQERMNELQQQNDLLHSNINELGEKMAGIQSRRDEEDRDTRQLAERVAKEPENKSSQQLLEVIKFLRKEKDIAEAKLSVVQAEAARLKLESDTYNKQLKETNASLEEERRKAQISVQTAAQHADLLRKVENLNILQESNRMLREERDTQARQVRQLQAQVVQLQDDMEPLQLNVRNVTDENENLKVEAQAYKQDIERWKARTNRLIEERVDPQEHKVAMEELNDIRTALATKAEEVKKVQQVLAQVRRELSDNRAEAAGANAKVVELTTELEKAKSECEAKEKEVEEKNKTILQLRNIGRKYRKQAEDTQKEVDGLKKRHEDSLKVNVPEMQAQLKTVEDKLKSTEEQLKTMESAKSAAETAFKVKEAQIKTLEEDRNNVLGRLGTSETEKTELLKKMVDLESKNRTVNEQLHKLQEDLKTAQATEVQLRTEKEEIERQKEQHRKIVMGAKNKLKSQSAEIETLKKECEEFRSKGAGASQSNEESEQRLRALKSQYESRATLMRNEQESERSAHQAALQAANSQRDSVKVDLDTANKRINELSMRTNQLQKLLDVYKSQISSVTSTAQKVQASPMTAASEAPKTVSIRPMTAPTSTTQVRMQQGQSVQPMRSVTETRAMASIRPMAVVSTPVSTASTSAQQQTQPPPAASMVTSQSQTPTATVHPTTQDSDVTAPLQVVTSAQRPTQPVQAVSPHVEPESRDSGAASASSAEAELSTTQEPSSTSPALSAATAPSTSVSSSTPLTQHSQEVSPSPSQGTSSGVGSSSVFGTKRPRDEGAGDGQAASADSEQAPVKKTKTIEFPASEVSQSVSQSTDSVTIEEPTQQQQAVVESAGTSEVDLTQDDQEPAEDVLQQQSAELSTLDPSLIAEDQGDENVDIEVVDDDAMEDMQETEEDETVVSLGDEEAEPYEVYEDEEEGAPGDQYEQEEEEDGDDDCVMIVEDDVEDDVTATQIFTQSTVSPQQSASQPASQPGTQHLEAQSSSSTVTSQLSSASSFEAQHRMVPQFGMGRGARSQLQPFIIAGEQGHIDLGDDGCVPSTPTLAIPKRNDGFAEAISSPAVSRQFVFGQGGASSDTFSTQPDFGQLASQGGLDEPFIDLSQLQQQQQVPSQASVTSSIMATQGDSAASDASLLDTQQQVVGSTSSAETSSSQQATSSESPGFSQRTSAAESEMSQGQGAGEPEASTSREADKAATTTSEADDKSEASDSSKPKIEPIVWSDSSTSSSTPQGSQSQLFARQPNVQRYQGAGPAFNQPPQGSPVPVLGSPQYTAQQQAQSKRFAQQGARRSTSTSFRGRQTAFRSRRGPSPGTGSVGMQHQGGQQMPPQGGPGINQSRGATRGRGRRGNFRTQQF